MSPTQKIPKTEKTALRKNNKYKNAVHCTAFLTYTRRRENKRLPVYFVNAESFPEKIADALNRRNVIKCVDLISGQLYFFRLYGRGIGKEKFFDITINFVCLKHNILRF